ncbi:MAG: DUF4870 domain-containing protein [Desulfovibrionales bacterium]
MTSSTEQLGTQEKGSRTWGMLCHLSALSLFVGIPFGNLLGPLLVWLIKRNEHPFVDEQGRESLNFQISMSIYGLIAALFVVVLVGFFFLFVLVVVDVIFVVIASVKTSNGEPYRYPLTLRLIR